MAFVLLGPSISFDQPETEIKWSNPSPIQGETSELEISVLNAGGKGDLRFVLQRLVEGGNWNEESNATKPIGAGMTAVVSIPVVAEVEPGQSQSYRVLVLVDGVEMDRYNVDPLIVKETDCPRWRRSCSTSKRWPICYLHVCGCSSIPLSILVDVGHVPENEVRRRRI